MKTTSRPIRLGGVWLKMIVLTLGLGTLIAASQTEVNGFRSMALPGDNQPNLLAGFTFTGSITNDDATYLRTNMEWLREYFPEWYAYIDEAEPLLLSVDVAEGEQGRMARTKCCDERGYGMITFGDHFRDLTESDDPEDQTTEARQIAFLSTLIHETTHIRDQRAGGGPKTIDFTSCVMSEQPAYAKESEFKRQVSSASLRGAIALSQAYQSAAERQIQAENGLWKLACLVTNLGDPLEQP